MGDDLDVGQGIAELGQAARHVVIGRYQPQRAKALIVYPGPRFDRVTAGVVGLVTERHAASELIG